MCNILEGLILAMNRRFTDPKEDLTQKIDHIFTYAVIWGLGGSFNQQHHEKVIICTLFLDGVPDQGSFFVPPVPQK